MTAIPPPLPANSSRLVRCLAGLVAVDHHSGQLPPADRLAQLVDFADSIRLSSMLDTLPALEFAPGEASPAAVKARFLQDREAIVRWAIGSFASDGGYRRVPLPARSAGLAEGVEPDCRPYLSFYASQQREIEFRVHALQRETRTAVATLAPRLARLVALETLLGDTFATYTRTVLQGISPLLARRFATLAATPPGPPAQAGAGQAGAPWLDQFHDEMQALLLAEIDARLLPVLGLIEAIDHPPAPEGNHQTDDHHHG